ncbi:S8 family serine peptidase [Winogradskyella eckloniae]|uniref:S8 family serine peptidase n=1 Tax=Winogradskyella eckloniae TaxID=1089306 RepID=UPI00156711AA|nr:S8 family serine peptidase [Winogradskyella eckloniae]NRD19459.1 S8 family serine peptidase [Winogradskyella eckloniae]
MKNILVLIIICCLNQFSYAQKDEYISDLNLSDTNNILLKDILEQENNREIRIDNYLLLNSDKKRVIKLENGGIMSIYDIINGKPIYKSTDNLDAARATKTTSLQNGGSLGFSFDGSNIVVGVWDGGPAQDTHVEFSDATNTQSRIVVVDNVTIDGDTGFSSHGTHVSGTIGAKGVNSLAKGMAPNVTIKSYNWSSDTSEMLQAINDPVDPILLSNHSYGVPVDPNDGSGPIDSWIMGCYNSDAVNLDALINNNPQYLVVMSAGNSGSVTYTGGMLDGFDKLTTDKNSKNSLVVANANPTLAPFTYEISNLAINSSSSQGPTDDFRIKPDIAADGTNLFSPIPTDSYATFSGTSMSSPNTAGAIVLLQEYYKQLNNDFMLASTVKGLICHTALDDNANIGPDPKFGWGFLNVEEAANVISYSDVGAAIISELTLNQGETYSYTFTTSTIDDLKATICWTDMPGGSLNGQLNNPSPRLVNDLDLRITKGTTEVFEPWMLDFSNGTEFLAVKGDNIRDNIEVVEVDNADAGVYTITVTHKGTLAGNQGGPFDPQSQDFSLILTGNNLTLSTQESILNNSLVVFPNPNKGEFTISFDLNSSNDDVKIDIFDISGRLVFNNTYSNNSTHFMETINLDGVESGVYLAHIKNGNNITSQKIIIE